MYMTIVDVTERIQQAMDSGGPLVVSQDEYDAIEAAGLLHEERGLADVEVSTG